MRSCVIYQDLCAVTIVSDLGFNARLVEQTASQAIIDKYPIKMSTSALRLLSKNRMEKTGFPSDVHIQTTYHFRIGSSQQVGHATNAFVAKDQRRSRPAVYSLRHESSVEPLNTTNAMSQQLTFRIFREDLTRWHRHKRAMFPDYAICCIHRDIYTYPVATMASTTDIDSYVFEGTPEENKDAHLEKFKHDLNDELTRTFPTTPRPYDNVQVLLLCWEEADGNNHEDVVTFRNFLKNTFHYQTQIYNKRPRPPHPRHLLRRRGSPLHLARDLSRRQLQHPDPAPKIFHPAARDTAPRPRPAQPLPEAFAPHHGGPWQDEAGLHGGRAVPWLEHRMRGVGSGSSAWPAVVYQSYRLPLRYFYQAPSPPPPPP